MQSVDRRWQYSYRDNESKLDVQFKVSNISKENEKNNFKYINTKTAWVILSFRKY